MTSVHKTTFDNWLEVVRNTFFILQVYFRRIFLWNIISNIGVNDINTPFLDSPQDVSWNSIDSRPNCFKAERQLYTIVWKPWTLRMENTRIVPKQWFIIIIVSSITPPVTCPAKINQCDIYTSAFGLLRRWFFIFFSLEHCPAVFYLKFQLVNYY